MNRNINVVGMYYVNLHFSGVLDKINRSKEWAFRLLSDFCVYAVALEGSVRHSQPTGTLRSCAPSCSWAAPGAAAASPTKFCQPAVQPCSAHIIAALSLKNIFSPLFAARISFAVSVQVEGSSSMAEPGCEAPLHLPGHHTARSNSGRDGRGYSKPTLCAEANIWGGSCLAPANKCKYLRITDNEL